MARLTEDAYIEHTPANARLLESITGPVAMHGPRVRRLILVDGQARRINGRYIVGNVCVPDENGDVAVRRVDGDLEVVTRRHRFRIPKGHPWRGKRP